MTLADASVIFSPLDASFCSYAIFFVRFFCARAKFFSFPLIFKYLRHTMFYAIYAYFHLLFIYISSLIYILIPLLPC
jgi:hypothetical protein